MENSKDSKVDLTKKKRYTDIDDVLFSSFYTYKKIQKEGEGINLTKITHSHKKTHLPDATDKTVVLLPRTKDDSHKSIETHVIEKQTSEKNNYRNVCSCSFAVVCLLLLLATILYFVLSRTSERNRGDDKDAVDWAISEDHVIEINDNAKEVIEQLQELSNDSRRETEDKSDLLVDMNDSRGDLLSSQSNFDESNQLSKNKDVYCDDVSIINNTGSSAKSDETTNEITDEDDLTSSFFPTQDSALSDNQTMSDIISEEENSELPARSNREGEDFEEPEDQNDIDSQEIIEQFTKAVAERRFDAAESLLANISNSNVCTPMQIQNMLGDVEYEKAQVQIEEALLAIEQSRFFDAKKILNEIHEPTDYVRRQIVQRQTRSIEIQIHQSAGDELKLRSSAQNTPLFKFRWCPPGSFKAGGKSSKQNLVRAVKIEDGFWMLESEVTQPMWEYVMGTKPFKFPTERFQGYYNPQPAENVSYGQCIEFCDKLTVLLNLEDAVITLPTEEEWEYACCAGRNSNETKHGRLAAGKGKPSHVKSVQPNEWGIYDMCGNVAEFCLTDTPKASLALGSDDAKHITKGGNWSIEHSSIITPYYREELSGNNSDGKTGFRVIIKNSVN